ncbi:MAG: SDR family oxidoreductase [Saprospiraceae bacterium]
MKQCLLITGASSGIGYATAQLFLQKGWQVYGISRSGSGPDGIIPLIADVGDSFAINNVIKQVMAEVGRIDTVVHAAGIGGAGPIETFPLDEAEKIFRTNVNGALHLLQATLPIMREQKRGTFVVVSSIAGLMGLPFHGIYSASKFAVEGMVEALRLELVGSGVNAVSVCPGDTQTPIIGNQYRSNALDVPLFYRDRFEKADTAMKDSVANGISADKIAAAIWQVVLMPHPKVRYPVGFWLQKAAPSLKRWLPSRLFEWTMRQYYGL